MPTPAQIDEQIKLERDQIAQGLKRLRDNTVKLEESKLEGGIKRGDIIIQFDGKPVSSTKYFQKMVTNAEIGSIVSLKVFRDGKEKLLKIKVGKLVS